MTKKRKKIRRVDPFTGEVVTITESRRKMRKDEYVDIWSGEIKRRKRGNVWF